MRWVDATREVPPPPDLPLHTNVRRACSEQTLPGDWTRTSGYLQDVRCSASWVQSRAARWLQQLAAGHFWWGLQGSTSILAMNLEKSDCLCTAAKERLFVHGAQGHMERRLWTIKEQEWNHGKTMRQSKDNG